MQTNSLMFLSIGLFMIGVLFGCNTGPASVATSTPAETDNDSTEQVDSTHGNHEHASHVGVNQGHGDESDMEKMTEALADFSEEDRKSAMKQHFCPVTGEMLGTMGKPQKVEVEGENVWICCSGCKNKLLKDPKKYLAKLSD